MKWLPGIMFRLDTPPSTNGRPSGNRRLYADTTTNSTGADAQRNRMPHTPITSTAAAPNMLK